MEELIEKIKTHARENYETGGWDFLVECYEDSDIEEMIEDARKEGAVSDEQILEKIGYWMGVKDDHRKDIQATAW